MKTRGRPTSKKATPKATTPIPESSPTSLIPDVNPPKIFILPRDFGKDAVVVTLLHPRILSPARYYFCPETGLYEIKRIGEPKSSCRSILLAPRSSAEKTGEAVESANDDDAEQEELGEGGEGHLTIEKGYVSEQAELFMVTYIDALFLILPALSPDPKTAQSDRTSTLFLTADDIFEKLFDRSQHFRHITLSKRGARRILEARLASVCDIVEAGDEKMFRLNTRKLLLELVSKAKSVVEKGLPASIEEKWVKKPLQKPAIFEQTKEEMQATTTIAKEESALSETEESRTGYDSQASSASTNITVPDDTQPLMPTATRSSSSSPSSKDELQQTSAPADQSPVPENEEMVQLLRLRTAFSFILSAYVPPHLASMLESLLQKPDSSLVDFSPLEAHLAYIAKLRAEAQETLRTISNYSRKRAVEDVEAAEDREEKKRKKEAEDKKKKALESRGVKQLQKADVSGMKKMSEFFAKKAPAKK